VFTIALILAFFVNVTASTLARAADWPGWGRDGGRNMVSDETGIPATFDPGKPRDGTEDIDPATTKGVKWVVKLGSQSYGNPTIAAGKVFVGTNNESPRDKRLTGDRSVVMAFDEKTGAFLWQLPVPKLGSGKVNDWEYLGICSSPTYVDGLVYVLTNRAELLALDADGLSDGNDGLQDEGQYLAGPGATPLTLSPLDADIVWRFDFREELGVFPHNATSSSVLVLGDKLFVTTSNGVDWGHLTMPAPTAPALVVLDRKTGALVGEESSGISARTLHSNWSSPALAMVKKQPVVLFGGGDGFLYGFDPAPKLDKDGLAILKERFRYDGNPPKYRKGKDGKPIRYPAFEGPSEYIATPVFHEGRVYAAIGQDPEHGNGLGRLSALDPSKTGNVSGKAAWTYEGLGRSMSTVAISGGVLYVAEYSGKLHALDVKTGKPLWVHDTKSHIWGSAFVADGKVWLGNEDGVLSVFAAGREKKLLHEIELRAPIHGTAVVANGVLYVLTNTHLYAVAAPPAP